MIKINNNVLNSPDYILVDAGENRRAKKRIVEEVKVYGANGDYVIHDGAFESYDRELSFSVSSFKKVQDLNKILKDIENEIEFDYVDNSKYYADLVEFNFSKQGSKRFFVVLKMKFNPFRYENENDEIFTKSGAITNIGNVFSEPIIEIFGNGISSLTIGKQTIHLNLNEKATIDCRHLKQNIYDKDGNVKNSIRIRGSFFEIQPGKNGVIFNNDFITKVNIHGNWRWDI